MQTPSCVSFGKFLKLLELASSSVTGFSTDFNRVVVRNAKDQTLFIFHSKCQKTTILILITTYRRTGGDGLGLVHQMN